MTPSQSRDCIIVLVVLTIATGIASLPPQTQNGFPLVVAFGLSAIAVSIFHLGTVLSTR